MTIGEAISRLDALKHNTYSQNDKIKWLSTLDSWVQRFIDAHEGGEAVDFAGYTDDTDLETVLLVGEPYDEIYLRWMEAQIDYHNAEYSRYNNAITMFNSVFDSFTGHYTQTHMPRESGSRFIF